MTSHELKAGVLRAVLALLITGSKNYTYVFYPRRSPEDLSPYKLPVEVEDTEGTPLSLPLALIILSPNLHHVKPFCCLISFTCISICAHKWQLFRYHLVGFKQWK